MNKNKMLIYLILICSMVVIAFAGDPARSGTAAGLQVKIPVGTRNLAMSGADIANIGGIDAMFWNPAGLSNIKGTECMFSFQDVIYDITSNYIVLAQKFGNNSLAFSAKTISIGEIKETTSEFINGTGATFSPTFATLELAYARKATDRIFFGIKPKLVYESIPGANASALCIDMGLQYKNLFSIEGFDFGVVVSNVGTEMEYSGSGLLTTGKIDDKIGSTEHDEYTEYLASKDKLPAMFSMGLSYRQLLGFGSLILSGTFVNDNFGNDLLNLGAELNISDLIYFRSGYQTQTTKDSEFKELGQNIFGFSAGAGIRYRNLDLGYAFRAVERFDNNNSFSISFSF